MILKALYDYYNRMGNLAPFGFEEKEIAFIIRINEEGKFLYVEDTRLDKKKAKSFLVPKTAIRSSGVLANTLWDNAEYVLGYYPDLAEEEKGKEEDEELLLKKIKDVEKSKDNAKKKLNAFIENVRNLANLYPNNVSFNALKKFYELGITPTDILHEFDENLPYDIFKSNSYISFRLENSPTLISEEGDLNDFVNQKSGLGLNDKKSICLITGQPCTPVQISTSTKIPKSQTTAKLVAFQVNSGYDSYGKSQGENAPISPQAEAAYSTALLHLLGKGSENKFLLGNRTYVFWGTKNDGATKLFEKSLFDFLNGPQEDDPNYNIESVTKVFKSIFSGSSPHDTEERFFILGLAPNAARIAVVYWQEGSLRDFAANILQHIEDMDISDNRNDKVPYAGAYKILSSVSLNGKVDKLSPNMGEALIKSIFNGAHYPASLFQCCIRRIRASRELSKTRIAIIKAYLNRKYKNQNIMIMLNEQETNAAYLCGRLFAVLEKIQTDSNHALNQTIRDKYLDGATSSPSGVFPTLLKLSSHHLEKLSKPSQIFYERLCGSIVENIESSGFPIHLQLEDQGRFFVGYYHQRQELYKKKEENTND